MTFPHAQPFDDRSDAALHALEGIRVDGTPVTVELQVRQDAQGTWRGRLRFGMPDGFTRQTAEIFAGSSVPDLLAAARGLREHHYRDLFRSLA